MRLKIGILVEKVKTWFPKAQAEIEAHANNLETKLKEPQNVSQLPVQTRQALARKIEALPPPLVHIVAVEYKLKEVLEQWQTQNSFINALVVLGSPIEPLEVVLQQTLASWQGADLLMVKWLSWSTRPDDTSINTKLQEIIDLCQDISSQDNESHHRQFLIVIPNLSWCFLRCIEGLDSIELIQELIIQHPSIFWLIGCNDWAWQYLNYVCHTSAYFDHVISLPSLKDQDLKAWLSPVSDTLDLVFQHEDSNNNQKAQSEISSDTDDEMTKEEKRYFEHLTSISRGLSAVAAQYWLNSLRLPSSENDDEPAATESGEEKQPISTVTVVKQSERPNLPTLSKDERYLLFSLGLHDSLTLGDLALSLGEQPYIVQAQVQTLQRHGVIESDQGLLRINPTYYVQIQKDLNENKFLVGENR